MMVAVVFTALHTQLYVPLSSGWLFLMSSSRVEPFCFIWYFSPLLNTFSSFFHCTGAPDLEISQQSFTPVPSSTWIFFSSWRNVMGRSREDHKRKNIKKNLKQEESGSVLFLNPLKPTIILHCELTNLWQNSAIYCNEHISDHLRWSKLLSFVLHIYRYNLQHRWGLGLWSSSPPAAPSSSSGICLHFSAALLLFSTLLKEQVYWAHSAELHCCPLSLPGWLVAV